MVLKRLNGDSDDPEDSNENEAAESKHAPQFLPSGRQVSLAALRERIEEEFMAETASRQDIFLDAADESARRELIREVTDYVMTVEGINLSRADKANIL